jgi:oxygen-independent coproporphyrinogen III oxidase
MQGVDGNQHPFYLALMAGIYIHIPFCRKACHYCNFHFSTSNKHIDEMVKAICMEMELRKEYLSEKIETIYFGGGTPSLLSIDNLKLTIDNLHKHFIIEKNAEITLEANPDDINEEKLSGWKSCGINRLSIGVQSFFEEDLEWMNRAHNASQALQSVKLAQQKGFTNISIDLIYGSPTLSDEKWKENLQTAFALHITHLSCYALTVEPKTALAKMINENKKENIDTEKQSRHFEILTQLANEAGYEHYEISNFAKPDLRSKHNSSYWSGKNYLGLGPSAHSFNGESRQWNIANNALYMQSIQQKNISFEIEYLTATQKTNEYIMTALRTIEGINFADGRWRTTDDSVKNQILKAAKKWEANGNIFKDETRIRLTDKGKFFADGIAADLFR